MGLETALMEVMSLHVVSCLISAIVGRLLCVINYCLRTVKRNCHNNWQFVYFRFRWVNKTWDVCTHYMICSSKIWWSEASAEWIHQCLLLIWSSGGLLQWTMGNCVWWPLVFHKHSCGLSAAWVFYFWCYLDHKQCWRVSCLYYTGHWVAMGNRMFPKRQWSGVGNFILKPKMITWRSM